uniref:Uncharacterized protein n=1 Tax=Strongyloides venezuelensis TaxID=75913 RepID=A0A0K0FSB7_STRVS
MLCGPDVTCLRQKKNQRSTKVIKSDANSKNIPRSKRKHRRDRNDKRGPRSEISRTGERKIVIYKLESLNSLETDIVSRRRRFLMHRHLVTKRPPVNCVY